MPPHQTPLLVPSGSRFETDLQAVRAARGLSLSQIQQQTRIPVDVLRRFEDGALIGDPTYNQVYLKAFLKSYAKAIGLPSSNVLAAYQAQQGGGYDGSLHPDYKRGASSTPAPTGGPAAPAVETTPTPRQEAASGPEAPAPEPTQRATVPETVSAVRTGPADSPARKAAPAVTSTRVSRPAVPGAKRSYDKNWGLIIGLFVGAVAILGAILWFLVFDGGGSSDPDTASASDPGSTTAQIDSVGLGAGVEAGGKRLQVPIRITVTAGGNGLQNFRVTESPNERLGHWVEPGDSKTFESDSLVVLWGEGADGVGPEATLELQGERWTPSVGSVLRIDRDRGQRLLDSLVAAPPSDPQSAPDDGA